jgi:hypothetical protein
MSDAPIQKIAAKTPSVCLTPAHAAVASGMFVTARCGSSSDLETPLGEACAKIFSSWRRNGLSESDALEQAQNFARRFGAK